MHSRCSNISIGRFKLLTCGSKNKKSKQRPEILENLNASHVKFGSLGQRAPSGGTYLRIIINVSVHFLWCDILTENTNSTFGVSETDVMIKYYFSLFSVIIVRSAFTDDQDFCETNECDGEFKRKNTFYSSVKHKGEIPLTLSHTLLGKRRIS